MGYPKSKCFKWLIAFRAAAETGSMTGAAKKLEISQAAVSYLIHNLEKELGLELFVRRKSSIVLTREGEELYARSAPLVGLFNEIWSGMATFNKSAYQGEIFISTTHSFAASHLPEYIRAFSASNPLVSFSVTSGFDSRSIVSSVIRNDVDFGITSIDIVPENTTVDLIFSASLVLIAPKEWKFSTDDEGRLANMEELRDVPFITSSNGINVNKFINNSLLSRGITPHCFLSISNYGDVRAMVRAGLGCAIVENFERNNNDWYNVFQLPSNSWRSNYYVVQRKKKYISPQAKAFVQCMLRRHQEMT